MFPELAPAIARLTPLQWLICCVAALGFAFDLYEITVLPLIVRPALIALGNLKPGSPEFNLWVGGSAPASGNFQRLRGRPPLVSPLKSYIGRSFTAVTTSKSLRDAHLLNNL